MRIKTFGCADKLTAVETHAVSVPGQWPAAQASRPACFRLTQVSAAVGPALTPASAPVPRGKPAAALTDLPDEVLLPIFAQAGPFSAMHLAGLAALGNRRITRVSRDNTLWRQAEPPLFVQTSPFRSHRWLYRTFAKRMRWVRELPADWARPVRAVFAGDESLEPRTCDLLLKKFPRSLDLAYTLLARAPRHIDAASSAARRNFQVARVVLESHGGGVLSLDPALRNVLDFMVLAARSDESLVSLMGDALRHRSAALKQLAAVSRHVLRDVPFHVYDNEDLLVEIMDVNGLALCEVPQARRTDRVVDAALIQTPRALEYAEDRQGDHNTVLPLVRCDGTVLEFADPALQQNKAVCWAAVTENPKAVAWCCLPPTDAVPLYNYVFWRDPEALNDVDPVLLQAYALHQRLCGMWALGAVVAGLGAAAAYASGRRSQFTVWVTQASVAVGTFAIREMTQPPTAKDLFYGTATLMVALLLTTPL